MYTSDSTDKYVELAMNKPQSKSKLATNAMESQWKNLLLDYAHRLIVHLNHARPTAAMISVLNFVAHQKHHPLNHHDNLFDCR